MANTARHAQSPQLAMSDGFLEAMSTLPTKIRAQVRSQLVIFQQNLQHPSLNYETIKHAGDARMRSLRVSSNYRIILAHPDGSGVYILLWVDTHDDAYAWAQRHRLDDADERLGLAILPIRAEADPPAVAPTFAAPAALAQSDLLAKVSDDDLLATGVPMSLLPTLRACADDEALLGLPGAFREEVAEAVMLLALGEHAPTSAATAPTPTATGRARCQAQAA